MRPQASSGFFSEHQSSDAFYNQLIYILKGEAKFSDGALSDPESIDLIWILLRTMGLYLDDP